MKLFLTFSASAVMAVAYAVPAAACDMHGMGGYGGFYGTNWKPYNPRVSTMDPSVDSNFQALGEVAPVKPKRPSFSSAANRASKRALAKRDADVPSKADTADVKTASVETVSDTDR